MKAYNRIEMEDRGVTKELLKDLYINKNIGKGELLKRFNISQNVLNRWLKESNINNKSGKMYNFNIHYFDEINTQEKAYWLGFIWCDGYASERIRNGKITERPVKISLARKDEEILYKMLKDFDGNHEIKQYISKGFDKDKEESRLTFNNFYFGNVMKEKYGMTPHRTDASKVIAAVPQELERHFLRGIFDAEGSISNYYLKNGSNIGGLKSTLSFTTHTELIEWIQGYMIRNHLKENYVKTSKRHEDRDGDCVSLQYAGALQVRKIASHLYEDSTRFLERKFLKLLELEEMLENREEQKNVSA